MEWTLSGIDDHFHHNQDLRTTSLDPLFSSEEGSKTRMDGRKGWRFETAIMAVTLLNLGLLVNTWSENFYYNAIQMTANTTGAKDCWICTALP